MDPAASSDILLSTYISSTYGYGGTAYNYSINYDLNRGRELALSDLFVSGSDYLGFLSQISIYQLTTSEFFCADPKVFAAPKAENYSTWNITYYGLRLTFNLHDVTPGPCSTAVVLIPYGDLTKILDPEGPVMHCFMSNSLNSAGRTAGRNWSGWFRQFRGTL